MSTSIGVVVTVDDKVLAQWSLPNGRKVLRQGVIDLSLEHQNTILVAHWDEEGGPSFREAYFNGELRQDLLTKATIKELNQKQKCLCVNGHIFFPGDLIDYLRWELADDITDESHNAILRYVTDKGITIFDIDAGADAFIPIENILVAECIEDEIASPNMPR